MSQLTNMTYAEFLNYLERVADDFDESGSEATAEDYSECVRRFVDLIDRLTDIETQVNKSTDDLAL